MRKKKNVQETVPVRELKSDALVDIVAGYVARDPEVWSKTEKEKKQLRKMKAQLDHDISGKSLRPYREIPVYDNMIIYLKKAIDICGKKYTTLSVHCGQGDIPMVLHRHAGEIVKYKWVGKVYTPDKLPFWGKNV